MQLPPTQQRQLVRSSPGTVPGTHDETDESQTAQKSPTIIAARQRQEEQPMEPRMGYNMQLTAVGTMLVWRPTAVITGEPG